MTTKDDIVVLPDPKLRQKSQRIVVIDDKARSVIEAMKAATLDWEAHRPHELGVALAAIQIGQPLRIIIVRNNFEDKKDHSFTVLINPEIVKLEGQIEADYEGCLSVKDIYGKVPRYDKVRLRALDEEGHEIRVRAEGFLARVLQHEVDHIKGVVFPDHIKDKPQAFYKLTPQGKLEPLAYEQVEQAHVFET